MCPAGRKVVASSICEGVPKPSNKTSAGDLLRMQYDTQNGEPLSVVTAAGPFTTNANLEFNPLVDLLAIVRAKKPDVVILTGPFVDVNHPSVKNGMVQLETENGDRVTVPFGNIFSEKFVPELERCYEEVPDLKTQFVLVPSLDDAFHENVFPQPPFADQQEGGGKPVNLPGAEGLVNGSLGLQYVEDAGRAGAAKRSSLDGDQKRVHCVSNPATFKINDVVFGVTSIDPIMALNAQDCSVGISRMTRMAQHLIMQQSYMPLFPVTAGSGRNVDLRHMDKYSMEVTPDVLLVPSKLAPFAKDVCDTMVVNPNTLAKGSTGGSFAHITIHPHKREDLEKVGRDDMVESNIKDRARVQVIKI